MMNSITNSDSPDGSVKESFADNSNRNHLESERLTGFRWINVQID